MNMTDIKIYEEHIRGYTYEEIAIGYGVTASEARESVGKVIQLLERLSEKNV